MTDLRELINLISPAKQPDKEFFLNLLDGDKQRIYEEEHLKNVMLLLKALYINKLKNKIKEAKAERTKENSSPSHRAESYKAVLELNAKIAALNEKLLSYKPFFDEPYFARMDVVDDKEGYNSYYIGKRGDEGLEIVDWRAPLARRYYQKSRTSFKINDYDYKLVLRRALRTGSGKVIDYKNEYLSLKDYLKKEEIAGRDENIIFDPFLKEILSTRKDKREICDIIETIQEKQYEIITLPENEQFVVQGVAGSGKTMIMLHRLSYIMYNNESLKPSDVIVITPSDSFNAFIDELAQVLELERVKTSTLENYYFSVLKNAGVNVVEKCDLTQPVPESYLKLVYSDKFVQEIKRKLSRTYDGIYGMFAADGCNEYIQAIITAIQSQEEEYAHIKNASVRVRRCVLGEIKERKDEGLYYTKQFRYMFNCVTDVKEFLQLISDVRMQGYAFFYRQFMSFYKSLRYLKRHSERLCSVALDDLATLSATVDREIADLKRYKTGPAGQENYTYAERIAQREELKKEVERTATRVRKIADSFIPLVDFAEVLRGEKALVEIGKCETTYDVLRYFYRETVKPMKVKHHLSTKKLCRTDPYSLCLILTELGLPLTPKYRYMFIDEGQDVSLSEYAVLKSINDRAVFNVFGDLKQNVTPYRGVRDWSKLGFQLFNLKLNYRNTNQIVDEVARNLKIDMQSIGFDGSEVRIIDSRSATSYLSDKAGLRAVITSEANLQKFTRRSYNVVRNNGRISKTRINVLTVYESKGLEFSAVAVAAKDLTDNEKYIAYTRALKHLAIIR